MAIQNVTVTVTGIQKQIVGRKGDLYMVSAEEDRTGLTVRGTYSFVNGKHFLMYDEDQGEGYVTGNTVKISSDRFEVIKKGANTAHMYFRTGQRDEGWYESPFGRMSMVIDVKSVSVTEKEDGIRAEADYVLEMNGSPLSRNRICVEAAGILK